MIYLLSYWAFKIIFILFFNESEKSNSIFDTVFANSSNVFWKSLVSAYEMDAESLSVVVL